MPPPPHLRDRPKAQPPRQRGPAPRPGPAAVQGPRPARHGQHPARSDGHTPLPGEEGQVPRGRQGVAAGGLRAGRAALQGLPGGRGGVQHHAGHAVVSVAGRLSLAPLNRCGHELSGESAEFNGPVVGSTPCAARCRGRHVCSDQTGKGFTWSGGRCTKVK